MRVTALIPVLVAGALLAACTSMVTVEGALVLAPGGRAEACVDGSSGAVIRLDNEGPGRVDFATRLTQGEERPVELAGELSETGPLVYRIRGSDKLPDPVVVIVVLEAYADGGTTVTYRFETPDGRRLDWNVSR